MKPKTNKEIEAMSEGGALLALMLHTLAKTVVPGIATIDLEQATKRLIHDAGVQSSFLHYNEYPCMLCASVNEVVVHGIPSNRILEKGDIISLDLGIWYKKLALDAAITVPVGTIDKENQLLIASTKEALMSGIEVIRAGVSIGDIGEAIERRINVAGFRVIRELVGHGVGYAVHEEPQILNFGKKGHGDCLPENLVIAVEPMATKGSGEIILDKDGFSYKTKDGARAAHFEVTLAITKNGARVLTPVI